MLAIRELERLGYTFTLSGDEIRYTHTGARPDPDLVRALLAEIHERKAEALHFLRSEGERPTVCPTCGGERFWLDPTRTWTCQRCHPDPLTLTCVHNPDPASIVYTILDKRSPDRDDPE